MKEKRKTHLSQRQRAINALIDDPGLDAEKKATIWLRTRGFTRIKAHTRPNDPYDKVAWKNDKKWIIGADNTTDGVVELSKPGRKDRNSKSTNLLNNENIEDCVLTV